MNFASPSPRPGAGMLDFSRIWHIILRRAWLMILIMALCLGAAMTYLFLAHKMYTAYTVVQVEQTAQKIVNFQDSAAAEDLRSAEVVKTFEQVLSSSSLLLRVVQANHLADNKDFARPNANGTPYSDAELADRLNLKIDAEERRGTRLIDISVRDHNPVLAAQLAASLITEYRRMELEQKIDAARGPTQFLVDEEKRLKASMEASETAIANYRSKNQSVSLDDKENIIVDRMRDLNLKVSEAKGKRLELEGDVNKLRSAHGATSEELLQLRSIGEMPAIADLRQKIQQKEGEFAAVKERYLYKHIKYIEAQSSLQKLKGALELELANAASTITRSYQNAKNTEDQLETALHEQEQQALTLGSVAIPYNTLVRRRDTDHALYDNVVTRLKENSVDQGISPTNLRVVEAPLVPYKPTSPARLKTLAFATLAGVIFGTLAVLAMELLNHTLQTVDQAESELGLPLLAAVPLLTGKRRRAMLVGSEDAPQRESFRTLRTTLTMLNEKETRSVLFTSAVPGEGKSFCSLNYAATLAKGGLQTLLINADLRRPCDYADELKCVGKTGLKDCLAGKMPLEQAVHPTMVQHLYFCPAGEELGDPADLLTSKRLGEILNEAFGMFDRVVIDSPPIHAVSDCLLLASHVETVCLVVRAGRTPLKAILRACRTLSLGGVIPIGFVINRMSLKLASKSTHYYYGQEYHEAEKRQNAAALRRP